MKRALVAAALVAVSSLAFAEVSGGNSRARGMNGAMTAVNDDMNTLFYNPAGLAYLKKNYLTAQADLEYSVGHGCMSSALPELRYLEGSYETFDPNTTTFEWHEYSG